nr:hypothetical protein [Candidatus Njordarchaeota archaeon]
APLTDLGLVHNDPPHTAKRLREVAPRSAVRALNPLTHSLIAPPETQLLAEAITNIPQTELEPKV